MSNQGHKPMHLSNYYPHNKTKLTCTIMYCKYTKINFCQIYLYSESVVFAFHQSVLVDSGAVCSIPHVVPLTPKPKCMRMCACERLLSFSLKEKDHHYYTPKLGHDLVVYYYTLVLSTSLF